MRIQMAGSVRCERHGVVRSGCDSDESEEKDYSEDAKTGRDPAHHQRSPGRSRTGAVVVFAVRVVEALFLVVVATARGRPGQLQRRVPRVLAEWIHRVVLRGKRKPFEGKRT